MAEAEILDGVWRFEAVHPEWTEAEGGEDGWEATVAWYAVAARPGLLVIDPLLEAFTELDDLVERQGGCAGVVRTVHWHERSVAKVAARYDAPVWAGVDPEGESRFACDHVLTDGDTLPGGLRAFDVRRADERALLLPSQRSLLFADAMLRRADGTLCLCPESWTQPPGGRAELRRRLSDLAELPVDHVLVMHGQPVLGDGRTAIRRALD